ncbi:50S ribosomal protein L10 [Methanofervidicoccus sp. A16]|uniref:50S ribosomal protein L10 n=1 Tax=Methanofervidicoccus sp. A16 TaxID=2607662 RepID=UPI0011881AB6|nr:50S ribosomal protein L10 [Methanofervidicoccus sp. A16]AXI25664.1 50S ribosomal protein L10 [Methanofervidicoccus sp. A16]MBW9220187.1 50S ribosomal protein L10 [Methanothermococcus sp. SCGC AD-155-N22]
MSAVGAKHVAPWKIEEVNRLKKLLKEGKVVALADLMDVPARQLQEIRDKIRGKMILRMSRNSLIERAIKEVAEETNNPEFAKLANYIARGAAIIVTDMNPFKLYKTLEESKTPAPIRGGAIAPCDIVVEKGSTGMPPGPFLGELKSVGIPAVIEKGKIAIKEDTVVVKEGEVVPHKVAVVLANLGIKPVKVGIDLLAAYEDGVIYTPDILKIDEEKIIQDIQRAFTNAFNLSVEAVIPTAQTIETILQKAFNNARTLSIESAYPTKETVGDILAKGYSQMLALASELSEDALDEELKELISSTATSTTEDVEKEEKKEEKKEEEKKEEAPAAVGLGLLF